MKRQIMNRCLPVHYQMCQYKRFLICRVINHSVFAETQGRSALIINALPPKFLQKRFPLLFPWCICSIVYMEQTPLDSYLLNVCQVCCVTECCLKQSSQRRFLQCFDTVDWLTQEEQLACETPRISNHKWFVSRPLGEPGLSWRCFLENRPGSQYSTEHSDLRKSSEMIKQGYTSKVPHSN